MPLSYTVPTTPLTRTNKEHPLEKIIGDLQPWCAVVYLDDITIFSPYWEQHLIDVEEVLKHLEKAYLKANVEKCLFAKEQVLVLGHIVSEKGILPNPKKVQSIVDMPAQETSQE